MTFRKTAVLIVLIWLGLMATVRSAAADDPYRMRPGLEPRISPGTPQVYQEQCGSCHMAYPAFLLPTTSWNRLVSRLDRHFGERLKLDAADRTTIGRYLDVNSANRSTSGVARQIMSSLGGRVPMRITDVPYLRLIHQRIDRRYSHSDGKRTGRFWADCQACHPGAEAGRFDDDVYPYTYPPPRPPRPGSSQSRWTPHCSRPTCPYGPKWGRSEAYEWMKGRPLPCESCPWGGEYSR